MSKQKSKRLLIFFGVHEAERSFASATLEQLLDIWGRYDLTVHIQDDASPSQIGLALAQQFSTRARIKVTRIERSLGYHGTYERCMSFLHAAAGSGETYDYVIRIDADAHLASRKLESIFERLPSKGLIGHKFEMRRQDFLLWLSDLFPVGMRRRVLSDGSLKHDWEPRIGPVWWWDIGLAALWRGFRGRCVHGALQIIAWPTLVEMERRGWLNRPRTATGLIFQDDLLISTMVEALGHPIVGLEDIVPGWNSDLFLRRDTPVEVIRNRQIDFLHPLKDSTWAQELRAALPMPPSPAT